jgi:hypothetical protein
MIKRYQRQSFLGEPSEELLRNCRAAIVGLGGGGSHFVQQLAHEGIGNFLLMDPDKFEESNLNRLVGAKASDIKRQSKKTSIAARLIKGVNPHAQIQTVAKKWQEAHEYLRECDVIFGCVDSYAARHELEILSRRYLIPYIDIGMDVHKFGDEFLISGQVILSMPGSLCMRCLGFLRDDLLAEEAKKYGKAGSKPQVVWSNGVLASAAIGIFTQLFTPWSRNFPETIYLEYDGNLQTLVSSNRLLAVKEKKCTHFMQIEDLGDPFWTPIKVREENQETKQKSSYGQR